MGQAVVPGKVFLAGKRFTQDNNRKHIPEDSSSARASMINPNVADLCRAKTRQSAPDVAAHSLGQVEAYFTVREALAEASTVADGVFWREHSDFGWWRSATLG